VIRRSVRVFPNKDQGAEYYPEAEEGYKEEGGA
jgi:hypothetical protein